MSRPEWYLLTNMAGLMPTTTGSSSTPIATTRIRPQTAPTSRGRRRYPCQGPNKSVYRYALVSNQKDSPMKRYFKRNDADSIYGTGLFFVEYDGEIATRQVEMYGERWLSSREGYHPGHGPGLTDRPLAENLATGVFGPEYEIPAEEFEGVWQQTG